jgi:hypothetical protein
MPEQRIAPSEEFSAPVNQNHFVEHLLAFDDRLEVLAPQRAAACATRRLSACSSFNLPPTRFLQRLKSERP